MKPPMPRTSAEERAEARLWEFGLDLPDGDKVTVSAHSPPEWAKGRDPLGRTAALARMIASPSPLDELMADIPWKQV